MAISYSINLEEEGRDFPHYWELSVGSCHAATILRADVQEQIKKAHRDIGFQYLRFHGLLDDDMSVVIPPLMPGMGEAQISFFNIDRIFDFLLDIGMKPFVELGFMPEAYASTGQTTFHYRGFSSMPKRDEDWIDLIDKLVRHLEERYGEKEVRSWFFEVWNEPNLRFFFDGTMEDYFHLYEMTAKTIKQVDACLKVGGPATSNNMWIPEFRQFCDKFHPKRVIGPFCRMRGDIIITRCKPVNKFFQIIVFKIQFCHVIIWHDRPINRIIPYFGILKHKSFRQNYISLLLQNDLQSKDFFIKTNRFLNIVYCD